MLNFAQNLALRTRIRNGLEGRASLIFVPPDMSGDEIAAKFPREMKLGLIGNLATKEPVTGPVAIPRTGPAVIAKRVYYPPPPSWSFPLMPGVSTPEAWVSLGMGGPTMIEHVNITLMKEFGAVIDHVMVGLHVCQAGGGVPFAGDMSVFGYNTPIASFGIPEGDGVVLASGRTLAAIPGDLNSSSHDFFPRMRIPFSSFRINCSTFCVLGVTEVFVTIDFGGIEASEDEVMLWMATQPRITIPRTGVGGWTGGGSVPEVVIPMAMPIQPPKPTLVITPEPVFPPVIAPPTVKPIPAPSVIAPPAAPKPYVPVPEVPVVVKAPAPPAVPKAPTPVKTTYTGLFRDANDFKEKQGEGVKVTFSTVRAAQNDFPGFNIRATVFAYPGQVPMAWMGGLESGPSWAMRQ